MKTQSEMMNRLVSRAGEDDAFRARLVADPKKAIEDELGVEVPDWYRVEVHEDGADVGHLVLPPTGQLSDSELAAVHGGSTYPDWTLDDFERHRAEYLRGQN